MLALLHTITLNAGILFIFPIYRNIDPFLILNIEKIDSYNILVDFFIRLKEFNCCRWFHLLPLKH